MKTYLLLTKPGIIMGNAITMASAFALASSGYFDLVLFVKTLFGLGCVIASACVFNHYLDRDSDARMERTKDRPLVTGAVSGRGALLFMVLLGAAGFSVMATINAYAFVAAAVGFFVYVAVYTLCKHHTVYGTLVGSIAGAMPPVVGYCAVKNGIDLGGFLLFAILVLWQMPHFYAIALYRYDDYSAARIPVLPVVRGVERAKVHILVYIGAFIAASLLLTLFDYTGMLYLATVLLFGAGWLVLSFSGFFTTDHRLWGRNMFAFSLVVVTFICGAMAIDAI